MRSLDSINGPSIQTLLRRENNSKQSDEFQAKVVVYRGVTDWSIPQLLTDNWLDCGEIASNKNSHASQSTANNSEPSSNLSNKTFKDNLQEETAVNFLKGNEFKAILPDLKKV